jgi:hypothetical protein
MANNPISPVITLDNPNVEGPGSGMEGGSSNSVIGIATDVINPTLSSFPRIEVGARSSPIGLPSPALGAAAYYVDYENDSFDRSPVIFAEADNDAAVGEVFANTLNFSVTNESSREIKTGEWLWGVAMPQEPIYATTGVAVDLVDWQTTSPGILAQDGPDFILFTPNTKLEAWNRTTNSVWPSMLVVGARYRVEITIGDNSAGTIRALTKNSSNNTNMADVFLSANTLGADQPFEFVAAYTGMQQNIRTSLSSGTVQLGEVTVYGPLAT